MNKSTALLPLAVAGLIAGFTTGCSTEKKEEPAASVSGAAKDAASTAEKHSCAGMNACKGQGGCKSGDAGCAGKNSCKGKGGCAVPSKH